MTGAPAPTLEVFSAPARATGATLVLHGGRAKSAEPTRAGQLAVRRMRPFARAVVEATSGHDVAVLALRYRLRGWNADGSPLPDAAWALAEIRRRHGDVPVVLVGHSMGARTALRVAGDRNVSAVAALAPWVPEGEPVDQLAGRSVLIVHGTLDTLTSPRASLAYAERARLVAAELMRVEMRRERHAMIVRPALWHRLVAGFAARAHGIGPLPAEIARALGAGGRERLRIRV